MDTPVFSSYIRRKDMNSVLDCMVTDSVGPGSAYQRFTALAKESFSCEAAAALRSPIQALTLALEFLGLEPGSGIIVSAFSPLWYDHAIRSAGFQTLVADVLPSSSDMDGASISALMGLGARAIVASSWLGLLPDFDRLLSYGLPVIEDASHSLTAFGPTRRAGSNGIFTILSLESGGMITAGEGALLWANGKREAQVLRNRAEALPRELLMSDFNASLGLAQLKDLEKLRAKRKEFYALFQRSLLQSRHSLLVQDRPPVQAPAEGQSPSEGDARPDGSTDPGEPSYFAFPVLLRTGAKEVRAYAKKKDIETMGAFEGTLIESGCLPEDACPQARALSLRTILFPLHPSLNAEAVKRIVKVLATLP